MIFGQTTGSGSIATEMFWVEMDVGGELVEDLLLVVWCSRSDLLDGHGFVGRKF